MSTFNDAQALSFVQGQFYAVNQRVFEARYPNFDYGRFVYVDTSGDPFSPGIITYTSDRTGRANWQSGYAKDVPLADVNQDQQLRQHYMAAIGYQWNWEEVNTAMRSPMGSLPDRRARAARQAYEEFMYNLTISGDSEKGFGGLINYAGVPTSTAAAVGTGGTSLWVNSAGVGQKTPQQILNDINTALQGVWLASNQTMLADTLLLPPEAYLYIAQTLIGSGNSETILSFVQRTNVYTLETGRQLTIRSLRDLSTAAAGDTGRMVAYNNDSELVRLHLPMPLRFLGVYQDGPLNWTVPGVFRTGGLEIMSTSVMRYVDVISEPPSP